MRLGLLLLALVHAQSDNAKWLENLEQLAVFVGERGHPDVPLDHPLGSGSRRRERRYAEERSMTVGWRNSEPRAAWCTPWRGAGTTPMCC